MTTRPVEAPDHAPGAEGFEGPEPAPRSAREPAPSPSPSPAADAGIKAAVRDAFTANADRYTDSEVHARGDSLGLLVERTQPERGWRVLDVATGAGHTAFAFAPHVAHVVATDLTPGMLERAEALARRRGLANVAFEVADAERLPFDDASFDLVVSRLGAHHFPDVARFLAEARRVLRPGGRLAIADNVVPEDADGAEAMNAFETLRDASHGRCLSMEGWRERVRAAGFELVHEEIVQKRLDFEWWAGRVGSSPETIERLRSMLSTAPPSAAALLAPITFDGRLHFHLREGIFVGVKAR